jgi:hypothetical protein
VRVVGRGLRRWLGLILVAESTVVPIVQREVAKVMGEISWGGWTVIMSLSMFLVDVCCGKSIVQYAIWGQFLLRTQRVCLNGK